MAYAQIGLSCRAPIEQTYNNAIHGMKQTCEVIIMELPGNSIFFERTEARWHLSGV